MIEAHEVERKMALRRDRAKVEMRKRLAGERAMQSAAMNVALMRGAYRPTGVAGPTARKRLPAPQLSML